MQAAPARYVSVSELYSTDEVELLLDEIRDLEPTSCRGEDVQDFEIAGSGLGTAGGGGGGGRSPAGTELTERSWDSHAHYSRAAPPRPRRLAPVYCAPRYLLTLTGAATLFIVVCSAGACGTLWAAAGPRVGRLPLAARPQLLLLGALSSLLLHALLLALHVTRLDALLPLRWDLLALATSCWSAVSLLAGGALTLHLVLTAREYAPAPPAARALLLSAAGLGMCGACFALAVVAREALALRRARALAGGGGVLAGRGRGASYRAVPSAPPAAPAPAPAPAPQPSTSRAHGL